MKIDEMPLNRPWTRDEILEVFSDGEPRDTLSLPSPAPSARRLLSLRLVVALPTSWAPAH